MAVTQKLLIFVVKYLIQAALLLTGTEFRSVSDELLSSFQLLLGAVDLCFKNALACEHKTALLNPDFPGMLY